MKIKQIYILVIIFSLSFLKGSAQGFYDWESDKKLIYDYSWSFIGKYRIDGWSVGFEYEQIKSLKKKRIFQFEILEIKSPKEKKIKRPRDFGLKPFIFGKQNNFFVMHFTYGNKFMLAEQARRNGVMINFVYNVGLSMGITKGYFMQICDDYEITSDNFLICNNLVSQGYDRNNPDNGFLNNIYNNFVSPTQPLALGYSGFGKGWSSLGFYPGLYGKVGMQFDWSNRTNFIKAIEVGFSFDVFYKDIPIMVESELTKNNRFYFPSVFLGMQLGKRKIKE